MNVLKLTLVSFFFSLLLLISACNENTIVGESTPVEIVFKAVYDGEPLIMNDRYMMD